MSLLSFLHNLKSFDEQWENMLSLSYLQKRDCPEHMFIHHMNDEIHPLFNGEKDWRLLPIEPDDDAVYELFLEGELLFMGHPFIKTHTAFRSLYGSNWEVRRLRDGTDFTYILCMSGDDLFVFTTKGEWEQIGK